MSTYSLKVEKLLGFLGHELLVSILIIENQYQKLILKIDIGNHYQMFILVYYYWTNIIGFQSIYF